VNFSVSIAPQNRSWAELQELITTAEELGYVSGYVFDHLLPLSPNHDEPIFEAWSALAGLAMVSNRIRLGTMVTSNLFRHPAVLAKMTVTIDQMSGGRLIVGIGTGYPYVEYTAYGIPIPRERERAERLAETCQILKGLWTNGRFSFAGAHYRIDDAPCRPAPVQQPHPPLLVGGAGEKLTFPTVARYADMWNLPPGSEGVSPERFEAKHEALRRVCAEVGRDHAEITSVAGAIVMIEEDGDAAVRRADEFAASRGLSEQARANIVAGDSDTVRRQVKRFEDAGVDTFSVGVPNGVTVKDVDLLGRTVLASW
jgi:F420-dependent oxidoreductase-like protein